MRMPTWIGGNEPELPALGLGGVFRLCLRIVPMFILVFGGLALLLLVRIFERRAHGIRRPITPHITVFVCRNALRLMGLKYKRSGVPMLRHGAMVANHSSWLDIFSLNAATPIYFVSKSEVSRWLGIGTLAKATGTLFIERDRKQAKAHTKMLQDRLLAGHKLIFFPEGTSTDGLQVLPFKTTLFASFLSEEVKDDIFLQPVSVIYHAPPGEDERFYGWWGDMNFGPHFVHTLAARQHGRVEVIYHDPIKVADYTDRKALAASAEALVRIGHLQSRTSRLQ
ncbi:MAG: lysophospholipid acyltransferase family protein [Aliishimia sp.]